MVLCIFRVLIVCGVRIVSLDQDLFVLVLMVIVIGRFVLDMVYCFFD